MFTRVQGPGCPRCGSEDTTTIEASYRWGKQSYRLSCNHCGKVFTELQQVEAPAGAPAAHDAGNGAGRAVPYFVVECPECGSARTRITSTRKHGVRYHKCKDCHHTFKSVERRGQGI